MAMQLGAFDYIVKPPKSIFDVLRKVRQAFSKQAVVRENRVLMEDLRHKNEALEHALEELREVQEELIQSEKLAGIGTLAAGIAHEISSPLFGVMGLAEAILEEEERSLVSDYATEIVEYSRSIKEIVVQLSGYSRTSQKEYLTTVDLGQVVDDAVRLVCRSAGVSAELIEVEMAEGLLLDARTNEIQQILVNLVKNAVEAAGEFHADPSSTRVRVEGQRHDDHLLISVSDNAGGIPEEHQKVVFDPFYTTKAPGKGTGLGLNIVWRIVTKYRGTISVASTPGEGTRFDLRFPTDP
jgi:C4-dicarboxylate-specific signal transduction histidine kinase